MEKETINIRKMAALLADLQYRIICMTNELAELEEMVVRIRTLVKVEDGN